MSSKVINQVNPNGKYHPSQRDASLHHLSSTQLASRCQNTQAAAAHEPFCFELFRRAIAEDCSLSWHYLQTQYYSLVRYWVSRKLATTLDTLDDIAQDTFTAFWRFYTPDKLAQADGLSDVLAYLKSCAFSAAVQANRRAARTPLQIPGDQDLIDIYAIVPSTEVIALQCDNARKIWARVEENCKDEQEHVLARLTFLSNLKPRQIAEQFPDTFPDVTDVYRIKRNLLERLRRDPQLKSYAKMKGISV